MSLATARLAEERKKWRKDHPFGFVAKPLTRDDGTVDQFTWTCKLPGKEGTPFEGGLFPVTLRFGTDYPANSPVASFPRGFKHPNVFEDGRVCLSIIGKAWKPSISVKEILLGLQELLHNPNETDPANWDVNSQYIRSRKAYDT